MTKPKGPGRPFVYPQGSRVGISAKIDRTKNEIIESNLSMFGVSSFQEWLNIQVDKSVTFITKKRKIDK